MGQYGNAATEAASEGSNASSVASIPDAGSSAGWQAPSFETTQPGNTPTDGTFVSLTPNQSQDVSLYGTSNPDMFDKMSGIYERFSKGEQQKMSDAWKNAGNNAETYGYLYKKLTDFGNMGSGSKGGQPVTFNIATQQPSNDPMAVYYRNRR